MDRIIDNFIIAARKYGLPVNFITRVRKTRYNFRGDASENFAQKQCLWLLEKMRPATCSSVNLTPDVRESIETFTNRVSSKLDVTSISTLYHESTHAYFYLIQEQDPTLLKFHPTALKLIEEGIKYYEKAPLVNGESADDPERVFMEAAATYVGSEIARWLITYELLNRLLERLNRPNAEMIPLHIARQILQKTIDRYNKPEGYYGYQNVYKWLWFGKQQVSTRKPIMPRLKIFLDTALLEHKIPPFFNSVQKFQEVMKAIKSKPPFSPKRPN